VQLGLGVSKDTGMVECEVNVPHIDSFGAPRVRSDSWRCLVRELSHECYADKAMWSLIGSRCRPRTLAVRRILRLRRLGKQPSMPKSVGVKTDLIG
jgi:hypothetical protein